MSHFSVFLQCVKIVLLAKISSADDTGFGGPSRRGPIFNGIAIPGNSIDKAEPHPQVVPGVVLPGQEHKFPNQIPFSPLTSVFGSSVRYNRNNYWSYGQVYHGVNPLDMDVASLQEAYAAASTPIKSDGQTFPFDSVVGVGGEIDKQKWDYITGGMKIPVLDPRWPNMFDLKGHVQMKSKGRTAQGNLNFPIPGTDERYPLDFGYKFSRQNYEMQYAQAMPNVNPFKLPKEQILRQLNEGENPNPTFLG